MSLVTFSGRAKGSPAPFRLFQGVCAAPFHRQSRSWNPPYGFTRFHWDAPGRSAQLRAEGRWENALAKVYVRPENVMLTPDPQGDFEVLSENYRDSIERTTARAGAMLLASQHAPSQLPLA
ncbi:hypothetical protein [Bifidobacterium sp.]|uniref:hypothetical protein n=1 Tax=Bifidobacterium sp. TaxID=41200 RepID=UPI0025B7FE80|nr:hypothetical protein [Bifidobacterium sp.]MCH4209571.1 hypothetical protein [Bifidobacterium sp.]MCI1225030.1 hypothetical protein [Bifidobacterium sp.]